MFLLLLLLVVVVAMAAAGLLGIGVLSSERRQARTGLLAALSAPVVLVAGLALLTLLTIGFGFRSGQEPESGGSPTSPAPTARPPSRAEPTVPRARIEPGAAELPLVVIRPVDNERFSQYRPVSGLSPGAVVRVRAEDFGGFERGRVEQCVLEVGREAACTEPFPVQFDESGRAEFPFAIRGDFAPGGCRVGQPTCLLRISGTDSGRRGSTQTVLVDRLVPGRVTVMPVRGLEEGQIVDVEVRAFPAGTSATAILCAPPDPYDARRCTAPSAGSTFIVDGGGSGRTRLTVAPARLGPDRVQCGPRRPCAVAVVVGPGFITAPATEIAFSEGPGVEYTAGRMATGIAITLALVGIAVAIGVRTDWTKPAEAATPEMDQTDLQANASLDELFGTDEELDEREPIPW